MIKLSKRTQKYLLRLSITILTLLLLYVLEYPNRTPQVPLVSTPGLYRVEKAVDGDTLQVRIGDTLDTVRLIGIDTPETHDPRKPVQCFGEIAAAYTKHLTEGREVRLEADPTNSDRDKYHRLLRYVYLPDGKLVNAEIIKQGYGFAYVVFPHSKLNEFRNLELDARSNNRGLWAGCSVDESSQIKQTTNSKN